jgi:hypothetical protein
LDDYEEGTWTPALKFGGASVGMTGTFTGTYTKIGRLVYVFARCVLTAKGSSTGDATITGLTFAAADFPAAIVDPTVGLSGLTAGGAILGVLAGTTIYLMLLTTTMRGGMTHANFTNTSDIRFGISYITT